MKDNIEEIMQFAIDHGGVTFNHNGILKENRGYIVSVKDRGAMLPTENVTDNTVPDFIANNDNLLSNISNSYIGLWFNEGNLFLDVSLHILDLDTALTLGIGGRQIAIYDLKNDKEIFL